MRETAPGARPVSGVPVTDPRHWSHHRRAQTDDELRELAAVSFVPDADLERARMIRARHPDVVPAPLVDPGALGEYETKRRAAAEGGRWFPEPSPEMLAAIDEAAAFVREHPDPLVDPSASARAGLHDAVVAGDFGLAVARFHAWLDALTEYRAAGGRRSDALAVLGHRTAAPEVRTPVFLDELERAIGGRTYRG